MKTVRVALIAAFTVAALPLLASVARADAYDDTVNATIRKNAEYPRLAKLHSLEGTVGFEVKIEANGSVSDASVESSSGQASLDNAALDTIKHLNFPAPAGGARTVHGTLAYRLM